MVVSCLFSFKHLTCFTFLEWTNHFVESMCFMYLGFLRNTKQIVVPLWWNERYKSEIILELLEIHIFYWWAILYLLFMCCNFAIEVWWYCSYQNICTLYFGFVCYNFCNVNLIKVFLIFLLLHHEYVKNQRVCLFLCLSLRELKVYLKTNRVKRCYCFGLSNWVPSRHTGLVN